MNELDKLSLMLKTNEPDKLSLILKLAVVASVVIALFKPILGVAVFIICVVVVASARSANAPPPTQENFDPELFAPTQTRFCNDLEPLTFGCDARSANQALLGGPNPKTYSPPIVAPPSHELQYWKATDFVRNSAVNDESNFDAYAAGYASFALPEKCRECAYVPCMCRRNAGPKSRTELLSTATIQPGVYQRSLFDEPINSNIGISFQKQFDPMLIEQTSDSVKYSALPPVTVVETFERGRDGFQSESNVFDPRFTGYGPSNRGYLESVTGQPRFFYDDIDSIKMPNFISRNNIDVYPWAVQYGQDVGTYGGDDYRRLADNAYLDASLKFRTELQERLMRKRNAELWQRRLAPISTMSNSGCASCV